MSQSRDFRFVLASALFLAVGASPFLAGGADGPANVQGPYVVHVKDLPRIDPQRIPPQPKHAQLPEADDNTPYPIDEGRDEKVEPLRPPMPKTSSPPANQARVSGSEDKATASVSALNSILSASATWLQPLEPYDYIAASNGTVVVSEALGSLYFTDMNGNTVHSPVWLPNLYCGGATPPPACSSGGFADHRLFFDKVGGRWIIVSLNAFGTTIRPVPNLVAVSQTSDPTGSWNVYQIPTCGPADVTDLSDQPHVGFNKHWIAINSACTTALGGKSLQVLHKDTLYSGGAVVMGSTWWEFSDVVTNNDGRLNHPVATYTNDTRKLYLVHAQLSATNSPQHVYSFISGNEFAPFVTWADSSVTVASVPVAAGFLAPANAPGCAGCLQSLLVNGNAINSASLIELPDGNKWLLSSSVWKYPTYANTNLSNFIATNTATNTSLATIVGDQAGVGMMSAAITAPFQSGISGVSLPVFILWSSSASNFYPGIQYYVWNLANNTYVSSGSWSGTQVPAGCTPSSACRWIDFIDSAAPVKTTVGAPAGTVVFAGPIAYSTSQTRVVVTRD